MIVIDSKSRFVKLSFSYVENPSPANIDIQFQTRSFFEIIKGNQRKAFFRFVTNDNDFYNFAAWIYHVHLNPVANARIYTEVFHVGSIKPHANAAIIIFALRRSLLKQTKRERAPSRVQQTIANSRCHKMLRIWLNRLNLLLTLCLIYDHLRMLCT